MPRNRSTRSGTSSSRPTAAASGRSPASSSRCPRSRAPPDSLAEQRTDEGAVRVAVDILALGEAMIEFNQTGAEGGRTLSPGLRRRHLELRDLGGAPGRARRLPLGASATTPTARCCASSGAAKASTQSGVRTDGDAFTAVYFVTHDAAGHHFSFFRRGSAASRLDAGAAAARRDRSGARASSLGHLAGDLGRRRSRPASPRSRSRAAPACASRSTPTCA